MYFFFVQPGGQMTDQVKINLFLLLLYLFVRISSKVVVNNE